ncbi:MAG TPA: S8 family serine peptidase [Blastocatellia bacterium]|nr:S8 family serine peptidase [Blastocatellia bacterium]
MRNTRVLTLALVSCLVATAPAARLAATKNRSHPKNYAPGELIVKLKVGAPQLSMADETERLMTIARLADGSGARAVDRPAEPLVNRDSDRRIGQMISNRGLDRVFVLKIDESADVSSIVSDLRSRGDVEYAEPNYLVTPDSVIPDDPDFSQQWALLNNGVYIGEYVSTPNADIKAYQAWDITLGSPNVIVALTDTGVDQGHPDLAQSIYTNAHEIPGNGIDDDHNGFIDDVHGFNVADQNGDTSDVSGHGTQMAGVIAAGINNGIGISGVSQSKILPVKFYQRYGPFPEQYRATVADAAKALLYSVAAGASIINASWRTLLTPEDVPEEAAQALKDAVNVANDAGVLMVCTAGNDGFNLDYSNIYPASYRFPNQIVVAASDYNDEIWHPPGNPFAILTGFGPNSVHLAAPGVSVLTTQAHGDCVLCSQDNDPAKWYTRGDGTSMSAAFVSGVAALVKSRYPDDSAVFIKQRIMNGAEVTESLRPYVVSGGRLSAMGALTSRVSIVAPVLDEVKYKSKKLTVFGSGMQPGMFIVVGKTAYPGTAKSDDGTRFLAKVPKSEIPAGTPVTIKLRNPDGGESKAITFTR